MKTWQYLHSNTWNFPPAQMGTGVVSAEASIKTLTAIFVWDGKEGLKRAKKIEMGSIALSMPEKHNLKYFLADVVSIGRAVGPFAPVRALFIHLGYGLVAANLQGQPSPTSSCAILLARLIIYISVGRSSPSLNWGHTLPHCFSMPTDGTL